MTGLFALLVKELRHHLFALIGAWALVATGLVLAFAMVTTRQADSVLGAGAMFCLLGMPMFALVAVRRVVVIERQEGSHAFLAALPVEPWQLAVAKWTTALAATWSTALVVVLTSALFAQHNELAPPGWVALVTLQVAVYLFAWHGVAFGAAHLGRWRAVAWLAIFLGGAVSQARHDGRYALWFGALAQPVDQTRYDPPFDELPTALAWGLFGTAVGLFAATWRGGVLADAAWRPQNARQQSLVYGLSALLVCGVTVVDDAFPEVARYDALPLVGAGPVPVRAAGNARAVAAAIADDLRAAAFLGDQFPAMVVLARHRVDPSPIDVVSHEGDTLVIAVDLARPLPARRSVLDTAINERAGGWLAHEPDRAFLTNGLGAWIVDGCASDVMTRRAGYAARLGVTTADLADWGQLQERLGPDVAEGVGWAGLCALEAAAGKARAQAFVARVALPRKRTSLALIDALRLRLDPAPQALLDETGTTWTALTTQWIASLEAAHLRAPEVDRLPLLTASIARRVEDGAATTLDLDWGEPGPGQEPPSGVTVRWTEIPRLRSRPDDWPEAQHVDLLAEHTSVPTTIPGHHPIAVALTRTEPSLDGDIRSPWVAP